MDKEYKQHIPDSSFIFACLWNIEYQTLAVLFKTGSIWVYYNVPEEVYEELITAESTGNYFNSNIRNVYEAEKIDLKLKASTNNG